MFVKYFLNIVGNLVQVRDDNDLGLDPFRRAGRMLTLNTNIMSVTSQAVLSNNPGDRLESGVRIQGGVGTRSLEISFLCVAGHALVMIRLCYF